MFKRNDIKLERHALVWLTPQGWLAARDSARPDHADAIERWQRANWPAVVRRSDADAAPDEVCLGIALPPHPVSGDKLRIGLRAQVCDVARMTPALALNANPALLPEKWQTGLRALAADSIGLTIRLHGSVALQAVTGLSYVRPASDIDLLFYPASEPELRAGLALLTLHAATLPLDGEIVFPDGDAVAWKEWLMAETNNARVLVKQLCGVRLAPMGDLLATLRPT